MSFNPQNIAADFPIFTKYPHHYLDNAAMTQVPQQVLSAIIDHETEARANIHRSGHFLGERATIAYEDARQAVADYLNIDPDEVIFTSGSTQSLNLVAYWLGEILKPNDEVIITEAEHHSNFLPWLRLASQKNVNLKILPIRPDGCLDIDKLPQLISKKTKILAITQASNVSGAITDVKHFRDTANAVGALLLLDAAQAMAHQKPDLKALDSDFYVFSGHKIYGPTGIGILAAKAKILQEMPPFLLGGGMVEELTSSSVSYLSSPFRFEAGTQPLAQAQGLKAALEWSEKIDHQAARNYQENLMTYLWKELSKLPRLKLIGPPPDPNKIPLISFNIEGAHPHDVAHILNQNRVAVRAGQHCAKPLFQALKQDGAVRASFALYNGDEDAEALLKAVHQAIKRL